MSINPTPATFVAVSEGDYGIVQPLVNAGHDIHEKDEHGNIAMHAAALTHGDNAEEVIDLLLSYDLDINAKNDKGETPLYVAVSEGMGAPASAFIARGADVDAVSDSGQYILHQAAQLGGLAGEYLVEELLNARAKINVRNKDNETPEDVAQGRAKELLVAARIAQSNANDQSERAELYPKNS